MFELSSALFRIVNRCMIEQGPKLQVLRYTKEALFDSINLIAYIKAFLPNKNR